MQNKGQNISVVKFVTSTKTGCVTDENCAQILKVSVLEEPFSA
jgi:hypothetical protein